MGGEGDHGPHPDYPSGQPYSAPRSGPPLWLFDVDVPVPTYPGRARAGYDGPNNLAWPGPPVQNADGSFSHLPPPQWKPTGEPGKYTADLPPFRQTGTVRVPAGTFSGGDGGGGRKGSLAAALVLAALLVVVAAYCVTRAAVGGPLFGGPL